MIEKSLQNPMMIRLDITLFNFIFVIFTIFRCHGNPIYSDNGPELLVYSTFGFLESQNSTAIIYSVPLSFTAVDVPEENSILSLINSSFTRNILGEEGKLQYNQVKYLFSNTIGGKLIEIDFLESSNFNENNSVEIEILDCFQVDGNESGNIVSWNQKGVNGTTHRDGFFQVQLRLLVKSNRTNQPSRIKYRVQEKSNQIVHFGDIFLLGNRGLTALFDIDETLKPFGWTADKAFASMFFKKYQIFSGVPETVNHWKDQVSPKSGDNFSDPVFFYLSLNPWQLSPALYQFILDSGLPEGPVAVRKLETWGIPTKDTIKYALKYLDVTGYKSRSMSDLCDRMPNRVIMTCGDSAMNDPEAFGQLMRMHPDQTMISTVRLVPGKSRRQNSILRFSQAYRGTPLGSWHVYQNITELWDLKFPSL